MKKKICLVIANYYPEISSKLLDGAIRELRKYDIKYVSKKFFVPGVFEIPVIIANNINYYDAFIVLGCVIKGKTPHFDLISKAVIDALMNLSITYKKPIGNGMITCLNKRQGFERANPKLKNKGGEAAKAVLEILKII